MADAANREIIGYQKLDQSYADLDDMILAISSCVYKQKIGLYRKYFPNELGEYTSNEQYKSAFNAQLTPFTTLVD